MDRLQSGLRDFQQRSLDNNKKVNILDLNIKMITKDILVIYRMECNIFGHTGLHEESDITQYF